MIDYPVATGLSGEELDAAIEEEIECCQKLTDWPNPDEKQPDRKPQKRKTETRSINKSIAQVMAGKKCCDTVKAAVGHCHWTRFML